MSPLRWLARSPRRLLVTAILALCLALGFAPSLSTWMRDSSTSPSADMGLHLILVFLLLTGGFCVAVLAGDRIFPHRWRERIICGLDVPLDESVLPKTHLFGFALLAVAAVVVGALAIEGITGGFFSEYQRVGHKRTILRSPNTRLKLELVDELGQVHRESRVRDAMELLDVTWRDPRQPTEIREAALVGFGRLSGSLVSSMQSWLEEDIEDHWEFDLVRHLRDHVAPDLRAALPGDPASLGPHTILALGKLRDRDALPELMERVTRDLAIPDALWSASVLAIGLMRDPDYLRDLARLAPKVPAEGLRPYAWAVSELSRHYIPGTDKEVDAFFPELIGIFAARLEASDDPAERCDLLHVLRATGHIDVAAPLYKAFDGPGAEGKCPTAYVEVDDRAPKLMGFEEPLRIRVLQGLANVALGDPDFLPWARERVSDEARYGTLICRNLAIMIEQADKE